MTRPGCEWPGWNLTMPKERAACGMCKGLGSRNIRGEHIVCRRCKGSGWVGGKTPKENQVDG